MVVAQMFLLLKYENFFGSVLDMIYRFTIYTIDTVKSVYAVLGL